ncbi:hypothetical protein PFISCL1PPCAC_15776 [Pristionchus fissidentatus]|uniref:Piwi domain-containing protein n=1 Tax=Pristionchus fissidentatus TaxID=1538716 RepID=A0AAV5W193_9BILA|nr:hypothetical protein PFISCL1PPCAC_15776 [Pristionchus fissidentatus]
MSETPDSGLSSQMQRVNISSGYDSGSGVSGGSGSGSGSGPPQRKADHAYNHMPLAVRPGECKASRSRIDVVSNYFRLNAPVQIRYISFRVDFEVQSSRNRGQTEPVKKEKMAECFKKCYEKNKHLFPRKAAALVYNGTDVFYTPTDFRISVPHIDFVYGQGPRRGNRPGPEIMGRMIITPLPMVSITTVRVNSEEDRCALMQFLDCVISQDHRFDLTGRAARFVQHGHSLFKIPMTPEEKRLDVKSIGKGEEVWLGLHCAVKTEFDELLLNADTSGSIFKSRNLNLIEFYAQVMQNYTLSLADVDFSRLTIEQRHLYEMERVLKGTKLQMKMPNKEPRIKKFEGFSKNPASADYFRMEGQGEISVADYFLQQYQYRLECPHFPCLTFFNKTTRNTSKIPMEFFSTLEEPTRFKGKLTDIQLDVFIKAVCQTPKEKKNRIERLCAAGQNYFGDSECMREWGISLDRKMVAIDNCPLLPLPHIEMKASQPQTEVNGETGEWKITEKIDGYERPIGPVESSASRIVLIVTFINERAPRNARDEKREHGPIKLIMETMRQYKMNVHPMPKIFHEELFKTEGRFVSTNNRWIDGTIVGANEHCAKLSAEVGEQCIPLHFYVFPRRQAKAYAAIKYYCDVVHGVVSQCAVRKAFDKLDGNAVTNTSAQNLLLKIMAKCGIIEYRLSSFKHKNIERMQNEEDPVLILGVDVSHPSREERFDAIEKHEKSTGKTAQQANKFRGRHEQLPTARPAGAAMFAGISFYDCPRSVVSVVGSIDIKGARYGVSSRVQRLGQEETVNMIEPFKERIKDFVENVGSLPKHVLLYRDGVSDSQLKKIAYEEHSREHSNRSILERERVR